MATVAVQIVRTLSDSGSAADQTTNVLHFDGGTDYASLGHAILMAFAGTPIGTEPAFTLYQQSSKIECKVYDLADPKPRPERYYEAVNPGESGDYQARLLAVVLSFYAGRNIGSQRGRIFLGPLPGNIGGDQVPDSANVQAINLAKALWSTDNGTWNHVVYSQKLQAPTQTITNYFSSNSWGVQHSRALASSSRETYVPS